MPDTEKAHCAPGVLPEETTPAGVICSAHRTTTHDTCAYLEEQVDEITGVLVDHGYLGGAESLTEAVQEMAADAAEAQRARGVLVGDNVLEEQYDVAAALQEAIDMAADHHQLVDLLCEHEVMQGGEPIVEVVESPLATAAELERARELLLDDGRMQNVEDVPRAVQVLIALTADVRKQLITSGHLGWEATRGEADELGDAVRDAIAEAEQLRKTQQELAEMEEQSIDRGQRYFRERQYRVNVAAVASTVLLRAHAESHTGSVTTCGTCARDWAVVQEASGIRAPGN